jgi:hypothetical protein
MTHRQAHGGGRSWRRVLFYLGFAVTMPLVPALTLGRILFFGGLDLWDRVTRRRPAAEPTLPWILPFWLAWIFAVLCVAAAIAASVLSIGLTEDWPRTDRWLARLLVALAALVALYVAYRSAMAGTRSLQRALVANMAMLIALELEELRLEAEQRAQMIHLGRAVGGMRGEAAGLPVPAFLAEREEIREMLGEPTERALTDLLYSLQNFNLAMAAGNHPLPQPRSDLPGHLATVCEHLGRAMQCLAPFLRRPA